MKVKLKRERTGGVQTAKVRINGADLVFKNDVKVLDLDENVEHEVWWFLIGPTGAAVKVTLSASDTDQTVVEAKIKHSDGSQASGTAKFRIKGAAS